MSARLWWPHTLSIKAVAVIVNPVRVPAIVATVLYRELRMAWVYVADILSKSTSQRAMIMPVATVAAADASAQMKCLL